MILTFFYFYLTSLTRLYALGKAYKKGACGGGGPVRGLGGGWGVFVESADGIRSIDYWTRLSVYVYNIYNNSRIFYIRRLYCVKMKQVRSENRKNI